MVLTERVWPQAGEHLGMHNPLSKQVSSLEALAPLGPAGSPGLASVARGHSGPTQWANGLRRENTS